MAADPDPATRAELGALIDAGDEAGLAARFEHPLVFGTAGLRGPEMAGPAGMNRLSVRRATQGVIGFLEERHADPRRGVVVGRDARHGSEAFNDEVVEVLLGAGWLVHEMPRPLPTPLVPFGVIQLGAEAGIMVTASHNPPRDNGYKLYDADGAQIIPPADARVEHHMARAGDAVLADRSSSLHRVVEPALLARYVARMTGRFAAPGSQLRITYTPLHGVGGAMMSELLGAAGYEHVSVVAAQFEPDPDFPTLSFPNPEEPGALDLALAGAEAAGATLVLANDPDADRLGAAVRGPQGWRVLRGDEIGWLLGDYLLRRAPAGGAVATSLVSSSLLARMAAAAGAECETTLTGFKWIARAGGGRPLLFGYEEALGYAVDPVVRDKDGLSAALALCKLADELARRGLSLLDRLDEIERRFGVHAGASGSVRDEAAEGAVRLQRALDELIESRPRSLGGQSVRELIDLSRGWRGLVTTGVRFELASGWAVVRPSGTEPKTKLYVEIIEEPLEDLALSRERAARAASAVLEDLSARLRS